MPLSPEDLPQSLRLEPDAARVLTAQGMLVQLPAGARAFRSGDLCGSYLWVTAGSVRIQLTAENGRDFVLYRVGSGESCVMTTSCLFEDQPYAAEGICETEVTAVAIPVAAFRTLLGASAIFRDVVLADYARRVGDLLMMLDQSASQSVTCRLARLLLARATRERVSATHQDLAAELGTAREVVSRHLKDLERRGVVALGRGWIEIRNQTDLRREAAV